MFGYIRIELGQLQGVVLMTRVKVTEVGNSQPQERSVKRKTNQIKSFHIHIKRNLKHFGSNETVKVYPLKNM